jgi:uncharacterized protein (TIGR02001 family)
LIYQLEILMKKTVLSTILLATIGGISTTSQADALAVDNFSANIAVTTNYIFRGVSLSDDHGAVSGGFDWGYNGFYAGTWASSISAVETESFEIDYYAGYTGEVGAFAYSVDFIYYDYPGELEDGSKSDIGDLAYYEFGGSIGYAFEGDLAPFLGVLVMHSPEFYGETDEATAIEGFLDLALPSDYGLHFYYGTQELEEDKHKGIDGYNYYGVNLSKTVGKFDFTLGYSDTDSDGEKWANGDGNSELVFTVGASI